MPLGLGSDQQREPTVPSSVENSPQREKEVPSPQEEIKVPSAHERETAVPPNGESRGSSRTRKSVECFQFDKAHGYVQVSKYINSLIKHYFSVKIPRTQREQNYLYVLTPDPINGVTDSNLFPPDYFTRTPYLF